MDEHIIDKSAENKSGSNKGTASDAADSLFIRTNNTPAKQDETKPAENKDIKAHPSESKENESLSGKGQKHGADSLSNLVMNEWKELKTFGNKIVDSAEKTIEKTAQALKKGNGEESSILGGFEVSPPGHEAKASKQSSETGKEKLPEAGNKKTAETENLLDDMEDQSYRSPEAAYITVANKLADDPRLLQMVTDSKGQVNTDSINKILKVDAGAEVIAQENKRPGPQELTPAERQELIAVRTHLVQAVAGAVLTAAGFRPSIASGITEVVTAGLDAGLLKDLSTKNISKAISELKNDPQQDLPKGDLSQTAAAIMSAIFKVAAEKPPGNQSGEKTVGASADKPAPAARENIPQISDQEFTAIGKQVLSKLDTKHTGEITKEQLTQALEDPSFKGKEAQALAAMYHGFDLLHNVSKHESWTGSKCITAGDLDKYTEIHKEQNQRTQDAYDMKNWAHNSLSKFDKNNSGSLTKDELDKALKDPKTSENDRKTISTVQKHYSEMGHMWESGVNLKAFDDYAANINKDTSAAKLVSHVWRTAYEVNQGQKPDICHDLYADSNKPLESINPEAIRQGSIGDCYYVSALAAVAKAHPEMIQQAIKDNGDGTYTVTFPGHKDNPVTVKAPTEAEQGVYNHASPNGLWASVMEKAYGAYCQQHIWRRGPRNLGGGYAPEEGADGGGRTAGAMKLLTGSDVYTNTTTFTFQSTMAANLEKAFGGQPLKAVTAGINGNLPFTNDVTADQFYKGHAYTITNYVPDGKGSGMITIRNPWGGEKNTTDGTITVPLEKFMKNFSDISIER